MSDHKTVYEKIREWARVRGIYDKGDSKTQVLKTGEEFGELCKAALKRDDAEFYDAVGDCVVTLTNAVHLYESERTNHEEDQIEIEQCILMAYKTISNRKGRMINGTFVKDVS